MLVFKSIENIDAFRICKQKVSSPEMEKIYFYAEFWTSCHVTLIRPKWVKIGYYSPVQKLLMAMQTAEAVPVVRYHGAPQIQPIEWRRRHDVTTVYTNTNQEVRRNRGNLPKDPRQWTRDDVAHWLRQVALNHGLPDISPSKFQMNGKALCLMTPNMFLARVPLGGKLLYKDFQLRLSTALYSS